MKKQLLSLLLALTLCLGLAVPAFAAEDEAPDCQILKAGDTTFTLNGITFTLSKPVSGQTADDNATAPRTGEIVNVVPAGTTITFSPKPDDIDDRISVEAVSRTEDNKDAVVWVPVEMKNVDGGEIDDILVIASMGDDDEKPVYLAADASAAEDKKDETPAESEEKKDETPAETTAPKFADVAADSPFAAAIDWAVKEGITNGKTETSFGPGDTCTVSHILTFLWRANGKPGAAEGTADRDSAAKWAAEKELIAEGADVSADCTRAMAVTFMWKAAESPKVESEKSFTDVAADAEFAGAVAWAVENGVTSGTGDGSTFSPDNTCTRGQIATFLYRAANAASASPEQAESGSSAK